VNHEYLRIGLGLSDTVTWSMRVKILIELFPSLMNQCSLSGALVLLQQSGNLDNYANRE